MRGSVATSTQTEGSLQKRKVSQVKALPRMESELGVVGDDDDHVNLLRTTEQKWEAESESWQTLRCMYLSSLFVAAW